MDISDVLIKGAASLNEQIEKNGLDGLVDSLVKSPEVRIRQRIAKVINTEFTSRFLDGSVDTDEFDSMHEAEVDQEIKTIVSMIKIDIPDGVAVEDTAINEIAEPFGKMIAELMCRGDGLSLAKAAVPSLYIDVDLTS